MNKKLKSYKLLKVEIQFTKINKNFLKFFEFKTL